MTLRNLFSRNPEIDERDFIVPKNSNLFIGGLDGRSGTTWLMQVLADLLKDRYVVIGDMALLSSVNFEMLDMSIIRPLPEAIRTRRII